MNRPMKNWACALILSLASAWPANPIASKIDAQGDSVTIHAARLFDGRGKMLDNATIEVRGSKIVAVDQRKGPYTYDLPTATLLPGFIDVHTHIDWHFGPDGKYPARNETPEQRDAAVAENLVATLLAGFTTVQNVGSMGDAALRAATAGGAKIGPRILTSLGSINSGTPEQIRARVQQFKKDGADLIKIFASESVRTGGAPTLSQEQLDAACGEANAQGLRTLVHAHAAEAIMRATRAGCTQVEHGAFANEEALALMKARGTFFDPNIGLVTQNYIENKPRFLTPTGGYSEEGFAAMEKAIPEKIRAFRLAVASGVRMPMGTDAVAGAHGQNAREIVARVKDGGQKPVDALIGATSLAAESMRMDKQFGSLAAGLEADIIAVAGNPLTDITAVRTVVFVMKGGKVYKK
jgi:imidazolonepropionase-like amidohydrolase